MNRSNFSGQRFAASAASLAAMLCAVALTPLLTACGKGSDKNATGTGAISAAGQGEKAGTRESDKINAYTEAYNKLIGTFGLQQTRERYFQQNIARRKPTDSISITEGWLDQALALFKKGRANKAGGLKELDEAADAVITPLGIVTAQLKELEIYYTSKAYKDDALAKGIAADAGLRANFDAAVAAAEKFSAVLGREEKKRNAAQLEELKSRGDLVGYQTKLALMQGQDLLDLFGSPQEINNAEQYKKGDALVVTLEKTLAEQRKVYAAAQGDKKPPSSYHESVASYLTSLLGHYRELKQSKKVDEANQMVKDYNSAIENANRVR